MPAASPSVEIEIDDTVVRVSNPDRVYFPATGATIKDLVNNCAAGARNHGGFVSCVTQLGNSLVNASILTSAQKGTLTSAAARSK